MLTFSFPFTIPFAPLHSLLTLLLPAPPPPQQLPPPEDDDGLSQRLAARRKPKRKPRRTTLESNPSPPQPPPSVNATPKLSLPLPEHHVYHLVQEASRRRRNLHTPQLNTLLPYDLQRHVFDRLLKEKRQENQSLLLIPFRIAADALRLVSPKKNQNVNANVAAAMAHNAESSAADAYAAAAAIASSTLPMDAEALAALKAAVAAGRAVANVEDAQVFDDTVGVAALVEATRVLAGEERAAAMTALANMAILLPKSRAVMLDADNGSLMSSLKSVVCDEVGVDVWEVEMLVSGVHLLGSLALGKEKVVLEGRRKMMRDTELVRGLMKVAEREGGAGRAGRRALGVLGVNRWRPRVAGQRGLRILCIDGGGTRAIMAFEMLKELKRRTGREIHEMFDVIGGTSTGAIVAVSVGIGRKSVEEVEGLYREMIGKVFAKGVTNGPKMLLTRAYYDTGVLESTLQRECGRGVFIDSTAEEGMNKVFVVSSIMSRNPKELHVFRNYTFPLGYESRYDGTVEAQLWEGLRASSAAPTFFSEIRVNGELHADGAIVANNPTAVALHETKCMYPGVPIELLVSLGNGLSPASVSEQETEQKNMGWGDVVGSIVASATSTEVVHHAMQDLFPSDKYYRLNPTTGSTQIDETHPDTLQMFVDEAQHYINERDAEFEQVARILRPKTPRSLWRRFRDALAKEIQVLGAGEDDLYLPE